MTLASPRRAARLFVIAWCCLVVAVLAAATPTQPRGPEIGPPRSDALGLDGWRVLASSRSAGPALVPRVDRLNPPSAVGYQSLVAVVVAALAVTVLVPLIHRTHRSARPTSSTRDPPLLG